VTRGGVPLGPGIATAGAGSASPDARRAPPGAWRQGTSLLPVLLALTLATAGCAAAARPHAPDPHRPDLHGAEPHTLAQQVEIRRTAHGVPHILAENLQAAAFALAWVQLEDHGEGIIRNMNAARGRAALVEGEARVDGDARARQRHAVAVAALPGLDADTRDIYVGFAEGMNHFIRVHRQRLPAWMQPDFTAADVLSRDVTWPLDGPMDAFRRRLTGGAGDGNGGPPGGSAGSDAAPGAYGASPSPEQAADNVGSNAFALAPERTASGRAILLRNPHLAWTAGYYEAHLRVPGKLDFYGDFRIGGPFTVIGGFNPYLGFSTTNNDSRSHEFYAFRLHPTERDHYLLDGAPRPLLREEVQVEYLTEDGDVATATRALWSTGFGPLVHRDDSLVYVYRPANMGNHRAGQQWLAMMQARSLEEWKDAMRIGARSTSNFTYADRDGNIFYVWVSAAPRLPHAPGGDTVAVLATRAADLWSEIASFDAMPQLLNPPGGYVRNENDSPHFTNLNAVMPDSFSFEVERPSLRLRSQHGLLLLHNDRVFSLEEVVEAKHSMGMLLADRVVDDLLTAVQAASAAPGTVSEQVGAGQQADAGDVASAVAILAAWDRSVAAESRGGVLFEIWWNRYRTLLAGAEPHAVPWSAAEPAATPRGLADAGRAVAAFHWAIGETVRRHGALDVPWGEVHRVRRGDVDVPVGGCSGALGCFRVLNFATAEDGRRVVNGGDGWVIAVEFGEEPRAFSVLAYGQSPDPASPYHADQASMFAENRMKRVFWTEADIEAATVLRYRPGQRRR
jgi:acyl-homoserine-lactone acylase